MSTATASPNLLSLFKTRSRRCQAESKPATSTVAVITEDSLKMQFPALTLFVIYLFVRFYVAWGHESSAAAQASSGRNRAAKYTSTGTATASRSSLSVRLARGSPRGGAEQESSRPKDSGDPSVSSSLSSLEEKELDLERELSESTVAERRRFLVACDCNLQEASDRLNHYLEWRQKYMEVQSSSDIMQIRPTGDEDYDVWVQSCLIAMKACGEVENIVLPRVIRMYARQQPEDTRQSDRDQKGNDYKSSTFIADKDGHRIFHIIPAMMDDKLAKQSTYTLAVALYMDRKVDRRSMETVTICMDVRAGRGWPNIHAVRLVPFMKSSLKLLLPLFPERLHKCVVYPLPSAFFYIWTMISKCMDK
ncbi:MAG: hypothetical protein SGILL_010862, partial [Bacillariaceae sp.]